MIELMLKLFESEVDIEARVVHQFLGDQRFCQSTFMQITQNTHRKP